MADTLTTITKETEVDAASLAVVLGLTKRRVLELASEETLERASRGRYNLAKCVQMYNQNVVRGRPKRERMNDADLTKAVAEAEYKKAKAEMAQLEADELKGKMHRADDVQAVTNDMVYAFRSALAALPGRLSVDLAPEMTPAEASELIKREVHKLMRELADYKYDPTRYEELVTGRLNWDMGDDDNG